MKSRKRSAPKAKAVRPCRARRRAKPELQATLHTLGALTHAQIEVSTVEEIEQLATHLFQDAAAIMMGLHGVPADATPRMIWSHAPLGRLVETAIAYARGLDVPLEQIVQHAIMHMNPLCTPGELRWN